MHAYFNCKQQLVNSSMTPSKNSYLNISRRDFAGYVACQIAHISLENSTGNGTRPIRNPPPQPDGLISRWLSGVILSIGDHNYGYNG